MNEIDITQIDLNLLVVLQVLLSESSVTRAARQLGVGQPAASHALMRLRELFADPLLVRVGRQMVPTPRAAALRSALERLLQDARCLLKQEVIFDPAKTARTFTLVCPDLLAPILPRLVVRLADVAPGARLVWALPRSDDAHAMAEGRIDLVLQPTPQEGPGLVCRGLGSVHMAVLARRSHPLVRAGRLTMSAWTSCPHVQVHTGHGGESIVASELTRASVQRRVGLVVPSFLSAVVAVAETDFFFTAPRELLTPLLKRFKLQLVPMPLPVPPVSVAAVWHERYSAEPAQRFFRELLQSELATLFRQSRSAVPGRKPRS